LDASLVCDSYCLRLSYGIRLGRKGGNLRPAVAQWPGTFLRRLRLWIRPGVQTLNFLLSGVLASALRFSKRSVGVALVYHRIGDPQGEPNRELVPSLGSRLFAAQLRYLRRHYRLVEASQLFDMTLERKRGQRFPVAVTFDDDLSSHTRAAMPILIKHGSPATFFVCGASLAAPNTFWWDWLQLAVDTQASHALRAALPHLKESEIARVIRTPHSIHHLARQIEAMSPLQRNAFVETIQHRLDVSPTETGLSTVDLRALAEAGFEIGFHTLRHHRLTSLDKDELFLALTEGCDLVAAAAGHRPTVIAYPHGDGNPGIASAARTAGYEFGFTGRPRPVTIATNPLLIGRQEPSFKSLRDFAIQIARTLLWSSAQEMSR
jgi:peptidoglycan/xylan/chitin deacetylase (PgdA/CDA1 family)